MGILIQTDKELFNDFIASGFDAKFCDNYNIMLAISTRKWRLIILSPDCTELAPCGNRWYGVGMSKHGARLDAIESLLQLWELAKKYSNCVAMRVSSDDILSRLGGHYIQTWEHGYTGVRIGFVLHNLDRLQPSIRLADKDQIETGLNNAIIRQWGVLNGHNNNINSVCLRSKQ